MDDAEAYNRCSADRIDPRTLLTEGFYRVGGRRVLLRRLIARKGWLEHTLVQILVVVANVQARTLKIEVEKGFALTAIGRNLVGP